MRRIFVVLFAGSLLAVTAYALLGGSADRESASSELSFSDDTDEPLELRVPPQSKKTSDEPPEKPLPEQNRDVQATSQKTSNEESDPSESSDLETTNMLRNLRAEVALLDTPKKKTDSSATTERDSSPNGAIQITIREDTPQDRAAFESGPPSPGAPTRQDLSLIPTPSPTAEPSPTPEPELPFVSGHPRGYTMLYAMQPEARATVESELSILFDARVRDTYLGVLTDGTFGWDPDYLAEIIGRVSNQNRRLTLVLYLSNGPTQRILEDSPITASFPQSSPEDFRELIRFDPITQESFRNLAKRVLPLFALNRRLNPRNVNIVVPMLEDNLEEESYRAMKEITEEVLGALALTVRNPCPGCYEGNDAARLGGPLELHGRENLALLQRGDAFSLDGSGYVLGNEPATPIPFRQEELQTLFQAFTAGGIRYVGLWRRDRQGLSGGPLTIPSEREYAIPSPLHRDAEIQLLRFAQPQEAGGGVN